MTDQSPPPTAEQAQAAPSPDGPWASRLGLVRPRHGRYLAGVCAAIGRATNTDPLLWRVLIGVLALFGVGIAIYIAGWLLIPAEGDTASPVEALFGRGHSSTSTALTLILGVIAVVFVGGVTDSAPLAILAAVALVVAVLALNRKNPPSGQQMSMQPEYPTAPLPAHATTVESPTGYRPPFAPHGPYAPPVPPVPPAPLPPLPKPEPSRLGKLIFGVAMIALGLLGLADMAGYSIPGEAYIAAPLAIVGLGLIVGAWYGRARSYIFIGLILAVLLPMVASGASSDWDGSSSGGDVRWRPASVAELQTEYSHRFGNATLDLRDIDFSKADNPTIHSDVKFGELTVILPDEVDATVYTSVNLGDATVFGANNGGVSIENTITDNGTDGVGGGKVTLRLEVKFGHIEVER